MDWTFVVEQCSSVTEYTTQIYLNENTEIKTEVVYRENAPVYSLRRG